MDVQYNNYMETNIHVSKIDQYQYKNIFFLSVIVFFCQILCWRTGGWCLAFCTSSVEHGQERKEKSPLLYLTFFFFFANLMFPLFQRLCKAVRLIIVKCHPACY